MKPNPCIECGACCAYFRASFYWREASDITPDGVPVELIDDLNDTYRVMKGTNQPDKRCIALVGDIGGIISCSIYERRPNPCRDFAASWIDGGPNERCDRARAHYGLPPLDPSAWLDPDSHIEPAA